MDKISCIMTTYRRFTCVERSIMMWLLQDYEGPSELIIYNTDEEYPLVLGDSLKGKNIRIINNDTDFETHKSYDNVGAIRRDAYKLATGSYGICWDDDDVFLPWNNRQCMDGIIRTGLPAWKPIYSLFTTPAKLEQARNTLEASIIVHLPTIRDIGFRMETASEHLGWYTELAYSGRLEENELCSVPGYSFNWSDTAEVAGHKQSGNIGTPSNFEDHKIATTDFAKRPLEFQTEFTYLDKYYQYFRENIAGTHVSDIPATYPCVWQPEVIEKYVQRYL
jgi:hypothetical protein